MIQEASVTGLFRTVFIIIGVIAVLRFIGRFIATKRQRDDLRELELQQKEVKQAKEEAEKNSGKITIIK